MGHTSSCGEAKVGHPADALKVSLEVSRKIVSVAVIVDAGDENAHRFYWEFGFLAFAETAGRLFLPMQRVGGLF